jgi:hypothetical protein
MRSKGVFDLSNAAAAHMLARLLAVLTPTSLFGVTSCGGIAKVQIGNVGDATWSDGDAPLPTDDDADVSISPDGDASVAPDGDASLAPDEDASFSPESDEADVTDAPWVDVTPLPPIVAPDGGFPSCRGTTSPEAGPCCSDVYCFAPDAAACPKGADLNLAQLAQLAGRIVGSGSCTCGLTTGPTILRVPRRTEMRLDRAATSSPL